MDLSNPQAKDYLLELYQKTKGDVGAQVSMFEVGTALNMERNEASKIAEDLIGDGLAQVKTLSGGIGITSQGVEEIQTTGAAGPGTATLDLGKGPELAQENMEALAAIVKEIQIRITRNKVAYDQLEEMVIDLKTIEVQLMSPRPKTAIVREVLRSLHSTLKTTGSPDLSEKIGNLIAT